MTIWPLFKDGNAWFIIQYLWNLKLINNMADASKSVYFSEFLHCILKTKIAEVTFAENPHRKLTDERNKNNDIWFILDQTKVSRVPMYIRPCNLYMASLEIILTVPFKHIITWFGPSVKIQWEAVTTHSSETRVPPHP